MQELIEGMLPIGSRLAENNRTRGITDRLTETVYGLAVGFHIQLL